MQRRLDLAASLVGRPQVLFLDEPTTGLDPRSRLGMWEIIRSLVAERHDAAAHHAVPGRGGRAGGRDRGHRPRPGHRGGHGRGAEGPGRRGRARVLGARPGPGSATRSRRSPMLGEGEPHVDEETGVISVGVGGRGSEALIEAVRALDSADVQIQGPGAAAPLARRRVPGAHRARRGRGAARQPRPPPAKAASSARTRPRDTARAAVMTAVDRWRRATSGRRAEPLDPGPLGGERHAHD